VSMGRISSLYTVSLLCNDNVESPSRRGEMLEKRAGGFSCYCMKTFCEKEFRIEYKAEVPNMGTSRNRSMLKLG
jgi:hypothetical protein